MSNVTAAAGCLPLQQWPWWHQSRH